MGGQCQNTGAGRCTGSARTTVRVFGHDYSVCYPCGAEIRRKQEHLPTRREEPVWQAGRFAAAMGSQHAGQQTRRPCRGSNVLPYGRLGEVLVL